MPMPGNCKPAVAVGDKTHQGPSSNDVIIRNNIANGLTIYNLDPNMTMDHNICLGIDGKCQIVTYVNGKPDWGVYKPGMHGDHNIIDGRGADGMFVSFDPAKFVYVRRAPAIGAGNSAETPFDPAKFLYDLRLRPGLRQSARQFCGSAAGRHYRSAARGSDRHWRLPAQPGQIDERCYALGRRGA